MVEERALFGGRTRVIRLALVTMSAVAVLVIPGGDGHAQTLRPTVFTDGPLPPLRPRAVPRPPTQVEPLPDDGSGPATMRGSADDLNPDDGSQTQTSAGDLRGSRAGQHGRSVSQADGAVEAADGVLLVPSSDEAGGDIAAPSVVSPPVTDFDPELFQTEVAPILDRRPTRLYRFEPWEQRGIHVGSLVVLPEVEAGAAWLSNVFRNTPARSDAAGYVRPSLRMRSNWRTHALELAASGNLSAFSEFSSEDDRAYRLEGRGRVDVTRATNIEVLGLHDLSQESRGRIDSGGTARGRSDVTTDQAAAAFNARFNRLTLQLRGGITRQDYSDKDGIGTDPSRDVTVREEAMRVGWEFKPTLTAFAELAGDQRDHAQASISDGIRRDSAGERYRAGLSFGNRGNVVRGEASAGWGRQTPEDPRLGSIDGVLVDANVAWRIDGLNALLAQARSDVMETTLAGSSGAMARTAGIEWRHAFLRALIGSAGIAYAVRDYQGVSVKESDLTTALGLEYYLGPEAMIFSRYEHIDYQSTVAGGDWSGDELRVGVRLRR